MVRFVKLQGGSCHVAKPTSRFYSQMGKIESRVVGRMVNKSGQGLNGRDIILNGCSMLLPKRVLFRTEHIGHAESAPNRITLKRPARGGLSMRLSRP